MICHFVSFNFYCYTDDSSDIDKKIKVIPITTEDYYEGYWNKLCMFQEDFIDTGDINLFFDLDVVIQNNLDNFIKEQLRDNLTMIRAYWKRDKVKNEIKLNFKIVSILLSKPLTNPTLKIKKFIDIINNIK